jgi:hypothetical protein
LIGQTVSHYKILSDGQAKLVDFGLAKSEPTPQLACSPDSGISQCEKLPVKANLNILLCYL